MKQVFIIGTDTDCGKTYVTCQLIDYLKQQQKRVLAIKPVASGCVEQDGALYSEDSRELDLHNGVSTDERLFWRFKKPVSPHLAAREEGIELTAKAVEQVCLSFQTDALDYLLIEGAGGLMVPLNSSETWIDFLIRSKIPVILVVGMRLGCINHALLTEAVLTHYNISCLGWIANCLDKTLLSLADNIETLRLKLSFPLLATVSQGGPLQRTNLNLEFFI